MGMVDITGIESLSIERVGEHPNEGVWMILKDRLGSEVWISIWIDYKELSIFFDGVALGLLNLEPNKPFKSFIVREKDAPSTQAEAPRV